MRKEGVIHIDDTHVGQTLRSTHKTSNNLSTIIPTRKGEYMPVSIQADDHMIDSGCLRMPSTAGERRKFDVAVDRPSIFMGRFIRVLVVILVLVG